MENDAIFAEILNEAISLYKDGIQVFGIDWLRTLLPEQHTQEAERILYGVANKNAAAVYIARRCEEASAAQRGNAANRCPIQVDALIESFSRESGFWIENTDDFFHSKFGIPISYGSEANIYYDDSRNIVVKTIDTELYGSIPKAIYRILIHNLLFPETTLNIVAFGRSRFGLFEIVAEQNFITGSFATVEQFEMKLQQIGLTKSNGDWSNNLFFVSDIKPKNAIIDNDGNVFVIDCYLEFVEKGNE